MRLYFSLFFNPFFRILIHDGYITKDEVETYFRKQLTDGLMHPTYFGSAVQNIGIAELVTGIKKYLPIPSSKADGEDASGVVFAIERDNNNLKRAYIRMLSGEIHENEKIIFNRVDENNYKSTYIGKITNLEVIGNNLASTKSGVSEKKLTKNNVGTFRGVSQVKVGDFVGISLSKLKKPAFSQANLSVVIKPRIANQALELSTVLKMLADEDPLIDFHVSEDKTISIKLFGEVQKEVIQERLRLDFGIDVEFEDVKPVYYERLKGKGSFYREFDPLNQFEQIWATIGIEVEPLELGTGNQFIREAQWGQMPAVFYKTIEETSFKVLEKGLRDLPIRDCKVVLTKVGFERPVSTVEHFRTLTETVLKKAIEQAGTQIYEPCTDLEIEVPPICLNGIVHYISKLTGEITRSFPLDSMWHLHANIPSRLVQDIRIALPGLSQGQGVTKSYPGISRPVSEKDFTKRKS